MAKRYVHNEGSTPIIVGGVFIPPGDGREVDDYLLPHEHQLGTSGEAPAPESEDPPPQLEANLLEMLAGSVASILPTLEGLGNETLNRLAELEAAAAKPRKTLQEAIAAELLKRAAAAVDGGAGKGEGEGEGEGQGDFQDTQPASLTGLVNG